MLRIRTHVHPNAAGLIIVDVVGHNRSFSSPLIALRQFHLRVASNYTPATTLSEARYGRLLKPRIDLELVRKLLQDCREHHGVECQQHSLDLNTLGINFRLIDVKNLCLCSSTPTEKPRSFAALSYVWGEYEISKLTQFNMAKYSRPEGLGPRTVQLPRTIRDEIEVTKSLGIDFLWVDQLCIQQDDVTVKTS